MASKAEREIQKKLRRRLVATLGPYLDRYIANVERNEWSRAEKIMRRRSRAMFPMPIFAVRIGQVGVFRNEEEGTEMPCFFYLDTKHRLRRTGGEEGNHPRIRIDNLEVWELKKLISLLGRENSFTTT